MVDVVEEGGAATERRKGVGVKVVVGTLYQN